MGLNEIKQLSKELAPDAWFPSNAPVVHEGVRTSARLGDYLMRWMTLDRDVTWTLTALAAKLCQATHCISNLVVLICDDKKHVPKMKAGEQAVRAESRAVTASNKGKAPSQPYPRDAVPIPEGIRYTPDGEDEPVEEEIDLNRLSLSRWYGDPEDPARWSNLGNDIWHAMHSDLADHLAARGARAREVLFDHCASLGTVRFTTVQDPDTGEWTTLRKEGTVPPHPLGEADTALAWHTAQHDGQMDAIYWDTGDSDAIAVYALYHATRTVQQRERTRIWWMCDKDTAVDLGMLIEHILAKQITCDDDVKRSFPSAQSFGGFCIAAGTDFLKHKGYAHGCGVDKMLMAWLRVGDAFDPLDVGPAFELWLRYLHVHKLFRKPVLVPDKHKKPPTPPMSLDAVRRNYVEKAPALAKARAQRQKKAMEKLANEWDHQLAPLRNAVREAKQVSEMLDAAVTSEDAARLEEMEVKAAYAIQALKDKHAEPVWTFPTPEQIAWQIRVIQWVYDYWAGASTGIVPPEPQAAKRTSPFFAPAASSSSAAAACEAAASSPSKRARHSSDDE